MNAVRESAYSESGLSRMRQPGAAANHGGMTLALRRWLRCGVAALIAVGCVSVVASASAPPVGPLPAGSVSDITADVGTLVAMAFPSHSASAGLGWRGARPVDLAVVRPLWDADVGASVVVVYRAVGVGRTTVVYALTRGETVKALQALRYRVVVVAPRCSAQPQAAAEYVIPPPPFVPRVISVQEITLPAGEPLAGGPLLKRLYRVTFDVRTGNAVLPAGHRYSQFAYVSRKKITAPWCFLKGGSGP
jgi:hypothetical protein